MSHREIRRVAIIGGARIPFCRAHTAYAEKSNQDMMTAVLLGLVEKYNLVGKRLGDVSLGAVIKHSSDWNFARECVLGSSLSAETPAFDLVRACGTGLEAAITIGNKIALGQIDAGIAGGSDTISDTPLVYPPEYQQMLLRSARGRSLSAKLKPWLSLRPRFFKPAFPGVTEPRTGLSMGESTELTAKKWGITRQAQDELAYTSHQNAAAAYASGFHDSLLVPFQGVSKDNNIRPDTTLEKLATLKPVFDRSPTGTMTAGNSTPLTDGASAILLASEDWAHEHNLPILAYLTYGKVAAVDFVKRDGLLMAPAFGVSEMLKDADLGLGDFDFYEIHEAFAAQVLSTLNAWESTEFCRERLGRETALGSIDRQRLNIKGGSIALGHPFAATGGRILGGLAKLIDDAGSGRGLVSICTGGGMGVTAILEK
ncbi:MAG: acetyl-CoA C-acetyltransferase [Gammaproteobacteria bacterium]|nr:acetyl-CoA C-acetyltransferase [Gammaproteobacteria bacterium]MCP4275030.1 acetyl-CoA C-acetyltransferase [Gammaproteobacteria bacterium]MCP4831853.1 acetyl-CoA C-acetyltransferase [Gammaproteobacteria bacterium]